MAKARAEPLQLLQAVGECQYGGIGVGAHSLVQWRVTSTARLGARLVLLVREFPGTRARDSPYIRGRVWVERKQLCEGLRKSIFSEQSHTNCCC